MDKEESTSVSDVGDVAELGVGEVVPIPVPDVLVNFHWTVFGVEDVAWAHAWGAAHKGSGACQLEEG